MQIYDHKGEIYMLKKVKEILDNNFNERNVRGGEATKQKYLKLKNKLSK